MADRIKLLPEIVSNQIKAGEVVEYPSSAVKEMVENAIDAKATSVTVNYVNGGRDLIQIIDDGCGMSPTDARMAFACHATSKVYSLDDIYALHTFGFRGEALASIAAISQVELITRQADDEIGTKTIYNGGEFVSQTPVAAPVGSQFLVRNIFYNTPVRRKFIDGRDSKMTNMIKTEFKRIALCHPEVAMTLLSNSLPLYNLQRSSLIERIVAVTGQVMRRNLVEINVETSIAKVEGYIGLPSAAKVRGADQYTFVNGRYFQSAYLNKAIVKAYEKLIQPTMSPSFFIYLTVDAERVDVNIHAKKIEVKFADDTAIWQILNAAVREALAKSGSIPMLDFDNDTKIDIPVASGRDAVRYDTPRATTCDGYNPFELDDNGKYTPKQTPFNAFGSAESFEHSSFAEDFEIPSSNSASEEEFGEIESSLNDTTFDIVESNDQSQQYMEFDSSSEQKIDTIVHLGNRYAAVVGGGTLSVIDLTRARERIAYDRYIAIMESGFSSSQQLLFPERLTLSEQEYELLEEAVVDFAVLGFDIELKGNATIDVRGIPANVTTDSIERTIFELLETLSVPVSSQQIRKEKIAQTLAKSESMRRITYTQSDAEAIVAQLQCSKEQYYTPAGKRISFRIGEDEFEKRLGN